MTSLDLQTLPTRRDEAWKWTDVRGRVSEQAAGLSVAGLPKFTLPEGVTVTEVESDDLDTDSAMAKLARNFGGKVWHCLLYTSPSPRDATLSRMPSSA